MRDITLYSIRRRRADEPEEICVHSGRGRLKCMHFQDVDRPRWPLSITEHRCRVHVGTYLVQVPPPANRYILHRRHHQRHIHYHRHSHPRRRTLPPIEWGFGKSRIARTHRAPFSTAINVCPDSGGEASGSCDGCGTIPADYTSMTWRTKKILYLHAMRDAREKPIYWHSFPFLAFCLGTSRSAARQQQAR
jgi:hypothetical protein